MRLIRVLLVDDDGDLLAGLRRALYRQPFEILCASSATEALRILSQESIDVIVSDEEMPGISGTDLLRKVQALYPETVRFILTGKATLSTAIQAINRGGISRFFLKPCNSVELAVSVRQETEKRDLAIAARRLLQKVRTQRAQLQRLEREITDITGVCRSADGAILLEDIPGDPSELIAAICKELEQS